MSSRSLIYLVCVCVCLFVCGSRKHQRNEYEHNQILILSLIIIVSMRFHFFLFTLWSMNSPISQNHTKPPSHIYPNHINHTSPSSSITYEIHIALAYQLCTNRITLIKFCWNVDVLCLKRVMQQFLSIFSLAELFESTAIKTSPWITIIITNSCSFYFVSHQVTEIWCRKLSSMQRWRNGSPEMSASFQKMTKGKTTFFCARIKFFNWNSKTMSAVCFFFFLFNFRKHISLFIT